MIIEAQEAERQVIRQMHDGPAQTFELILQTRLPPFPDQVPAKSYLKIRHECVSEGTRFYL
jgi:hypothetical protein